MAKSLLSHGRVAHTLLRSVAGPLSEFDIVKHDLFRKPRHGVDHAQCPVEVCRSKGPCRSRHEPRVAPILSRQGIGSGSNVPTRNPGGLLRVALRFASAFAHSARHEGRSTTIRRDKLTYSSSPSAAKSNSPSSASCTTRAIDRTWSPAAKSISLTP